MNKITTHKTMHCHCCKKYFKNKSKSYFTGVIFLSIIFLGLFGWAGSSEAATYYISTTGSDSNSGTSESAPWQTINKVNISSFSPGDSILFKKGETWREQLTVPSSGSSGNPITFGAYGTTGAKPIIEYLPDFPSWSHVSTWTQVDSSNVWTTTFWYAHNRMFLDSIEYMRAADAGSVDSTYRYFYDDSSHLWYVYSESNPATHYSSMKMSSITWYDGPLHISKDYINVSNIDLRGGDCAISIDGANHIDISSVAFGLYSFYGAAVGKIAGSGSTYSNSYINIHDSFYESGLNNSTYFQEVGGDGIVVNSSNSTGTTNSKFYNNIITNATHTGINIYGMVSNSITGNEVYGNDISCPNTNYGRGIELTGLVTNAVSYNLVYNNYLHDLKTSALAACGNHNKYYYNIIRDVTPSAWSTTYSGGIYLSTNPEKTCSDGEIYNNVVYNVASHGIWFQSDASHPNANNIIKNNVIMNWGKDITHTYNAIETNDGDTTTGFQTFSNNLFYKSGVITNVIRWKGTDYTVAAFEAASGSGWTALGNANSNPLFTNATGNNFTLTSISPAINAGTNVNLTSDYAGTSVPQGNAPDIGAYEYQGDTTPPAAPTGLTVQ